MAAPSLSPHSKTSHMFLRYPFYLWTNCESLRWCAARGLHLWSSSCCRTTTPISPDLHRQAWGTYWMSLCYTDLSDAVDPLSSLCAKGLLRRWSRHIVSCDVVSATVGEVTDILLHIHERQRTPPVLNSVTHGPLSHFTLTCAAAGFGLLSKASYLHGQEYQSQAKANPNSHFVSQVELSYSGSLSQAGLMGFL